MPKYTALKTKKSFLTPKGRRIRRPPISKIGLKTKISSNSSNFPIKSKEIGQGRRETSIVQKNRIDKMRNPKRVLAQFFGQLVFNFIAIYNVIAPELQPRRGRRRQQARAVSIQQITQFIGGNKWLFLKIFYCIVKANHLSMDAMIQTDFQKRPVIENVPGSFMHGLAELKESFCSVEEEESLTLRPIQVKIFYLISLLLVGVPKFEQIPRHIDLPTDPTPLDQMIDSSYRSIVKKLLTQTKMLSSIAFQRLNREWSTIIQTICIQEEIQERDQQQRSNRKALWLHTQPTIEQLKQILGKASFKDSKIADQQITNFIQIETRRNVRPRDVDVIQQYLNLDDVSRENSNSLDQQSSLYLTDFDLSANHYGNEFLLQQNGINAPQRITPNIQNSNQLNAYNLGERVGLVCIRLAIKKFNYLQKNKRKRKIQQNRTTVNMDAQGINSTNQFEESWVSSTSLLANENVSGDQRKVFVQESTENQPNEQSERGVNESMGQSQVVYMNSFQEVNQNAYHNVPHVNRDVDYLITELNENSQATARAIANHIYHTMKVFRMRIEKEEERWERR